MPSHEPAELLRRAETAQRLQSRGGLRGCGVALDSGSIDSLSDLRSAAVGDESVCRRSRARFSNRADLFLGFRDHAGRNQARIRS